MVTFFMQHLLKLDDAVVVRPVSCKNVAPGHARAFRHPVVMCCDMLGVVGANLKMVKFFMQHLWILYDFVVVKPVFLQQCCNRACALVRFSIPNMS